MSRYVTTRFTEYRYPETKNLACPGCGKKVRRSRTFTGTRNPFTTPPYMTYAQMHEQLRPEIDAWLAKAEACATCRDSAGGGR